MREYFYDLSDQLFSKPFSETIFLNFEGEQSDFCRLSQAKVRQAGQVKQMYCEVRVIKGQRHSSRLMTCSGDLAHDLDALRTAVKDLQAQLAILPEDPYLLYSDDVMNTEQLGEDKLSSSQDIINGCLAHVADLDFVGIFAQGGIYKGLANSLGQRNWYQAYTHNFDWSVYLRNDKAVKQSYAGQVWKQEEFDTKILEAREMLPLLDKKPRHLQPGKYRAYFAPAAFQEIIDLWNWGGFAKKSQATKTAPFAKFYLGETKLSPMLQLSETRTGGLSCRFSADGFVLPEQVQLIKNGEFKTALISPRSSKEYGMPLNAHPAERIGGFDIGAGELDNQNILSELQTGLLINNLWYLNYSDRIAGRMTGMTRFACFWVENGQIVAPLDVMRFDDSLSHVLGGGLEAMTRQRDLMLDASTYGARSTHNYRMPGILVNDFRFVL